METLDSRSRLALFFSLALHAAMVILISAIGQRLPSPVELRPPADVWAGETVDVDAWIDPEMGKAAAPSKAEASTRASAKENDSNPAERKTSSEPSDEPARATVEDDEPAAAPKLDEAPEAEAGEPEPANGQPEAPSSLAARILAYKPEVRARDDPAPTGNAPPSPQRFGSEAETTPVRSLARAFTRAIPATNTRDRAWDRLSLGDAGTVRVTLEIGDEGAIVQAVAHGEPRAHLERLVDRTVLALRGGRFAPTNEQHGKETLVLDVQISERPVRDGPLELGFEPPRVGRPGRAYFQLPSGRFVDVKVTIELL